MVFEECIYRSVYNLTLIFFLIFSTTCFFPGVVVCLQKYGNVNISSMQVKCFSLKHISYFYVSIAYVAVMLLYVSISHGGYVALCEHNSIYGGDLALCEHNSIYGGDVALCEHNSIYGSDVAL